MFPCLWSSSCKSTSPWKIGINKGAAVEVCWLCTASHAAMFPHIVVSWPLPRRLASTKGAAQHPHAAPSPCIWSSNSKLMEVLLCCMSSMVCAVVWPFLRHATPPITATSTHFGWLFLFFQTVCLTSCLVWGVNIKNELSPFGVQCIAVITTINLCGGCAMGAALEWCYFCYLTCYVFSNFLLWKFVVTTTFIPLQYYSLQLKHWLNSFVSLQYFWVEFAPTKINFHMISGSAAALCCMYSFPSYSYCWLSISTSEAAIM